MRINDVSVLAIVFLMGILAGTIGTVAVYHRTANQLAETEEREAQAALKEVKEERDRLQAQINDYQETERKQQQAMEQPSGDEPAARPSAPQRPIVAVTPRKDTAPAKDRETVPPPREDGSVNAKTTTPPVPGFGPPRVPPQQDDHATDTRPKTTP